jgi:hypothetical protein
MDLVDTITQRAAGDCLAHAGRELAGPLSVAVDSARTAWDPLRLRHVLELRMAIMRPVAELEVILDAEGRVVGCVDLGAQVAR